MCEKEYEIRQEIKELEDRKSDLVHKRFSYNISRNTLKNLYDATGAIYLMDDINKYGYAIIGISSQIQELSDNLLDKYKELNRIMECNDEKKRRDVNFFYGMDMFDILDRLERDGSINGTKF